MPCTFLYKHSDACFSRTKNNILYFDNQKVKIVLVAVYFRIAKIFPSIRHIDLIYLRDLFQISSVGEAS